MVFGCTVTGLFEVATALKTAETQFKANAAIKSSWGTTLGIGAKEASEGDGGHAIDDDLCEVLHHLDSTPGQPPSTEALEAAKEWTTFEDMAELAEAMLQDQHGVIVSGLDMPNDGNENIDSSD